VKLFEQDAAPTLTVTITVTRSLPADREADRGIAAGVGRSIERMLIVLQHAVTVTDAFGTFDWMLAILVGVLQSLRGSTFYCG
jgi:hypothetical protein